ncbi:MAG: hypothetical protein IJT91_05265 [Clostridia bacterium]|nr:hypothetical protein [Clostridia bacterium]
MKNNVIRTVALLFALILFALAAQSCGQDKATSGNKGAVSAASGTNAAATGESSPIGYEIGEGSTFVWTNSVGSRWIRIAVPITNTGSENLYLSSSTIDVEDADGTLVQSFPFVGAYPQVLRPGETAYYYEETLYDASQTEGLKVIPHIDAEKATVDCIRYDVSEIKITDTGFLGARVVGSVENNTGEDGTAVYITANLFDSDGNIIGRQFTILIDDLKAGEKTVFESGSLGLNLKSADIASYEVYAFEYQYQF